MTRRFVLLSVALAFMLGCPTLVKPVASLQTIGDPELSTDFASTGAFSVRALPIAYDGSVVKLTSPASVAFQIDSAAAGGPYTVSVRSVEMTRFIAGTVAYGFFLDGSEVMGSVDPDRSRIESARNFIRRLIALDANNKVAVGEFGSANLTLRQGYTPARDTGSLYSALDATTTAGDRRPLYSGLTEYIAHTDTTVPLSGHERRILVMTAGPDNGSRIEDSLGAVIALANARHVTVDVIALGGEADTLVDFSRLAAATSGVYLPAAGPGALHDMVVGFGYALSLGYDAVEAGFSPIPGSGTSISGRMEVYGTGTSASASLKWRIP